MIVADCLIVQNPKARGMLMSIYVLRTFAPHLNMVAESQLEDVQAQFGALGMACAAVSLNFAVIRCSVPCTSTLTSAPPRSSLHSNPTGTMASSLPLSPISTSLEGVV